jgi:hypothetical protein
MELIVGFLLGICGSLLCWFVVQHGIVPDIKFTDEISKIEDDKRASGNQYRFMFKNTGSRAAIDIELAAILRLKGLIESRPDSWISFNVSLDDTRIPEITPAKKGGRGILVSFQTEQFCELQLSKYITNCDPAMSLEDIMSLGDEVELNVVAFCYDSFSGTRKVFHSGTYNKDQIVEGKFDMKSMKVVQKERHDDNSIKLNKL